MFHRIRGIIALSLVIPGMAGAVNVTISGTDNGRIFHGIGLVSAGTSSTIPDYSEPYRSNILDYIFKPRFGMSLQRMRVEIGSGINSTSASEPSHAITPGEIANPVPRGLEFWLINEAKKRNPKIETEACNWSLPPWVWQGPKQQKADYYSSFVKCLLNTYGINLDYLNFNTNEAGYDVDFVKNYLRPTLDRNGYSFVKLLGPDMYNVACWSTIEADMNADAAFRNVVDVVASHFTPWDDDNGPSAAQIASGKMLGSSEMHNSGFQNIAWGLNYNYVKYRCVFTEVWYVVDAMYFGPWQGGGGMGCKQPWSGNYVIRDLTWAYAHTTQFTEPGWKYLDNACAYFGSDRTSSYVTLRDTGSNNWSMIIANSGAAQTISGTITGGLSTGTIHVWKSDANSKFIRLPDITPASGSFTLDCSANSVYSITTTTGQQKGSYTIPAPANQPMPLFDDYESYSPGQNPKYHSHQTGSWEAYIGGPGNRKCLRQIHKSLDDRYTIQASVMFPTYGTVNQISADVYVDSLPPCRVMLVTNSGYNDPTGFQLQKNGRWSFVKVHDWNIDSVLAGGTIGGFDGGAWHAMKVTSSGGTLHFFVDGVQVGTYPGTMSSGPWLRSSYHYNLFDNLYIGDGSPPTYINSPAASKPLHDFAVKLRRVNSGRIVASFIRPPGMAACAEMYVEVYDMRGRLLATSTNAQSESGVVSFDFGTSALGPGKYYVRLRAQGFDRSAQFVLL